MSDDIWNYPETVGRLDLTGFRVEAADGGIGKVDETSHDDDAGYIVVDTGPWIFGSKVLLPAALIDRIDRDDEAVYVSRTKDEIERAPKFDENQYRDENYRTAIAAYYGGGAGDAAGDRG
jgi:hypothetical protein